MDIYRFERACELVRTGSAGSHSEYGVHAVLRRYFQQDTAASEMRVGRYTADTAGENGVIEISTSHFTALRDKLSAFLPVSPVTVVYPVYVNKRIVYADESGCRKTRVSPLKGSVFNIFFELYHITDLLMHKNLSFKIMVMDCDEYRSSAAAENTAEDAPAVYDRMPTRLIDEITISCPSDWTKLIPCLKQRNYTLSDVAAVAHATRKQISAALMVLCKAGILVRTGRKGRSFAYSYYE